MVRIQQKTYFLYGLTTFLLKSILIEIQGTKYEPIKSFSGHLFQTVDQIFQFRQMVYHILKVSSNKSNY